jgi:dTDP-4-dehydrorhamnose reductase
MNILIAGGSGLLGAALYENLSNRGFNVKRINRFADDDIFFNYDVSGAPVPKLTAKYDVVVNCAYDYQDRSLSESNVNLIMARNLLLMAKSNHIPIFINISSMSAYDGCKSDYGRVKLKIEDIVSQANGHSFRLGLFDSDELIGLIKTAYNLSRLVPLFSIGVGHHYLPQYITNLNKFSLLLIRFIEDTKMYPECIYSTVNSLPLDFNDILRAVTGKPTIKIPLFLLKSMIFLYEMAHLPKIRFNLDSLNGLVYANDKPKNLIALDDL